MSERSEASLQEEESIDLYPLPESWRWGIVSDAGAHQKNAIVDGPFGSNLKVSDYVEDGPVPVLTTKNLEGKYDEVRYITKEKFEELKRSAVYPGDILMVKIGSCGKTGIYPLNYPPAMIPANLLKVSLNDQFELKFVYYYFNSSFFQKALRTITKATAQPAFGVTNFRKLPLPYTTRDQQKRIVAEIEKQFSRLDEAVATLNRVKANLKRYKASVLKAAVEGKLTEDWRKQHPNVEPASQLLENILAERRAKWKGKGTYKEPIATDPSNHSPLPKGWTWASVDQCAEVFLGKMLDKEKHRTGRQLPYLRNINVRWGRVDTDDLLEMFFKNGELERYGLLSGDVLVCEGGEPGRAAVWDGRIPELKYQKALHRVRLYGKSEPRYLVVLLEFLANAGRLECLFTGSTIKHFTRESFVSMPIPLPPVHEQKEIVAEVERRQSVIEELEAAVDANLTRAERLRQSILSRAFSGLLLKHSTSTLLDSVT